MTNIKKITTPLTDEVVKGLKAGDQVSISGVIYTARDAAHKLLTEAIQAGEELPVDFKNQIIYYAGPTPAKPGKVIGSCGPTTSGRMDAYSPLMMEQGLKGMIGKGPRSKEVVEAMIANHVVYFAAIGGAAALIADSVKEAEVVAFDELGPEAIRRLVVEDYPCIVAIDSEGHNLYELGVQQYKIVD
ncbi:Fe-S-containing hydro-lyase [Robertmurraya sp. DFI.2.37]|jgi:fumarate hydratase subunit beta|uniref:Fe-S-containing hydro-lyase n=1 Tax=Robertmurraya sp. DFI.2.37 TaxID=3031819 RepID=UPI001248B83F|nr:Fe-S-containing hydro-lyase [Robertmurraya sp. DFI.2.37]MDF1509658.1 Fe-S-containing hydro-lyase [Robertmurraya sp. DFI.2.37]